MVHNFKTWDFSPLIEIVLASVIYYKKRKENNGQKTKPFVECQQSNRHWLPNRFVFYKVNYLGFLNCQDIDLLNWVQTRSS